MRDSANDAFFTAESLENLSEALVREGIQNSLDAAQRDGSGVHQVRVRIAFQPKAPGNVREFLSKQFAPVCDNFARGLQGSRSLTLYSELTLVTSRSRTLVHGASLAT